MKFIKNLKKNKMAYFSYKVNNQTIDIIWKHNMMN
jgi:hypothetical protein